MYNEQLDMIKDFKKSLESIKTDDKLLFNFIYNYSQGISNALSMVLDDKYEEIKTKTLDMISKYSDFLKENSSD
jgi:hypothetical protein